MKSTSVKLRREDKLSDAELVEMIKTATPHQKNQIVGILMSRDTQAKFIFLLSGRIPVTLLPLHNYILGNADYMAVVDPVTNISNGVRLNLTAQQVLDLTAQKNGWFTGNPASPGVWDDHTNPLKKGKNTRAKVVAYIKQFNDFYRPLLNVMAASGKLNPTDRLVTNIAEVPTTHHVNTSKIPGRPYVSVTQQGSGVLKVICRMLSDGGKASLPEFCDEIETKYVCVNPKAEDSQLTPILKKVPPQSADDCFYNEFHSKSTFELNVGSQYSGLFIYGFCRYTNSKHHELGVASDWSEMFSIRVP